MRLSSLLILATAIIAFSQCDDSPGPGFFLKITKNVPRLGRRSESFFIKNSRTIPRIGRSDTTNLSTMNPNALKLLTWLKEENNDQKAISKRMMLNNVAAQAAAERELSVVQPVNSNTLIELLNKDAIPSENVKFVHWKDFDRALQSDMDLYGKIISIGRKPDQRLKDDLGFSTYVPTQFFNANKNNQIGSGFYSDAGNDIYAGKYGRNILDYNDLK